MPARNPGSLCCHNNPDYCFTPGTLGKNDLADVDNPIRIPRKRQPHGAISLAEYGEIVLAQHGTKSSLPSASVKKERFGVVLTSSETGWKEWATQYVEKNRSRSKESFGKQINRASILKAYRRAAKKAKGGGLIINAGHGYADGLEYGIVDLAPRKRLRLTSAHLRIWKDQDPRRPLQAKDKPVVEAFVEIGKILRKYAVKEVMFMSCLVGNAQDFCQEIANEWKITIYAYRHIIYPDKFLVPIGSKKRWLWGIYLKGKKPTTNDEKLRSTKEYPAWEPEDILYFTPKRKATSTPSVKQ